MASKIASIRSWREVWQHQKKCVEKCVEHVRDGCMSILINAPTGSGKTLIAVILTMRQLGLLSGGRVLWVVHRRELIEQAYRALIKEGADPSDIGVFAGGYEPALHRTPIVIASVQVLILAQRQLEGVRLVIFDEGHHYLAEEWGKIAESYANAIRIGLSATPLRPDGTPLGDMYEVMVDVAQVRELNDLDILVPCHVISAEEAKPELAADVFDAFKSFIPAGGRTIVFGKSLLAAEREARYFNEQNVQADVVEGRSNRKDRAASISAFRSGEIQVLTNYQVLAEGFDVQPTVGIILARGCSSVVTYLQAAGRGKRRSAGKDRTYLIDLTGVARNSRFGHPDADRMWSLDGRFKGECATGAGFGERAMVPGVDPRHLSQIVEDALPASRKVYLEKLRRAARAGGYERKWVAARYIARYGKPLGGIQFLYA